MKLTKCTNCESLEKLLSLVECTMVQMMKEKLNSLKYNIDYCFDSAKYKALLRYKRILKMRFYNPRYPASDIKLSTIIAGVTLLVVDDECSKCIDCDIETSNTTTTSTTTTSTTSTTSTTTQVTNNCSRYQVRPKFSDPSNLGIYGYSYLPCGSTERVQATIVTGQTADFCATPGSITVDPLFEVVLLNSICIP